MHIIDLIIMDASPIKFDTKIKLEYTFLTYLIFIYLIFNIITINR